MDKHLELGGNNMNTLDAIFSRKSVRAFTGDLTEEELGTLLKAACAAPVGRALFENVHLTVITKKDLLDKIDCAGAAILQNPSMHPLYNAPVFILVSAKLSGPNDNVGYSNCAGIVQNMALAAVELGLGSCHIWGAVRGINADPALLTELNLPEGFTPCCGLIVGKTEETYAVRDIPEDKIKIAFIK
ncbi:MAG TPA: nitroreductase [Papillibacter sp.]|jgi:nitroreductase|nr:nitroreductase [Papillibacter sp.]